MPVVQRSFAWISGVSCQTLDSGYCSLRVDTHTRWGNTLRHFKVRDMKLAQQQYPNDSACSELALLTAITEQKLTPEDLENLDLADYGAVQAAFRTLLDAAGGD